MAKYDGQNLPISWPDYYRARNAMFANLDALVEKRGYAFTHVITIPCGAMILGGHTAKYFGHDDDFGKLPIGCINVSSYYQGERGPLKHREVPGFMCNMDVAQQKECLLVDDMGDSCSTFKWAKGKFPFITTASPWVRYEDTAREVVDVWGEVLNHDTFLDFPWDFDAMGVDEIFTDQPKHVMDRLRA